MLSISSDGWTPRRKTLIHGAQLAVSFSTLLAAPTVALSTVDSAEYMATSNATKEAIWLRVLLEDL